MVIEFDPIKRDKTLTERGLDYVRAGEIFAELQFTKEDAREDYAEPRFISAGKLDGRIVILVWTPRGEVSRIISLMKANGREITCYAVRLA